MSIRFQADNDLKRIIVDATLRRLAAWQSRILVSHDKRTMPNALASIVASGGTSAGVLLVIPQNAPIREVVDTLILIWADDQAKDWENLLFKIPSDRWIKFQTFSTRRLSEFGRLDPRI